MSGPEFDCFVTSKASVDDLKDLKDVLETAGYSINSDLSEGRLKVKQ